MAVVDGEVDRRDLIIEAQVSASQFLPRAFMCRPWVVKQSGLEFIKQTRTWLCNFIILKSFLLNELTSLLTQDEGIRSYRIAAHITKTLVL